MEKSKDLEFERGDERGNGIETTSNTYLTFQVSVRIINRHKYQNL